jgi:hypothetical protein
MSSLFNRVSKFARSPQGRRMMRQAQDYARRPETKRKIADLRARMAKR